MNPVVRTQAGAVRGVAGDGVVSFKGIPFAAPLEGALRFQAPAPPEPWSGVRDTDSFSAAVPQRAFRPEIPSPWKPGDSTDALSVNVWTPELGRGGLPVMVWIYGGAWRAGHGGDPAYDGTVLARSGAVVVTFNYRVDFDGFGYLPDAPAPANRGLLDQLAALRWVRANIAGFGGDPDNVTVFGESAGAGTVVLLAASPDARGLFRRAIAQSVAGRYLRQEEARAITEMIAAELGRPATAEALAEPPVEALLDVQDAVLAKMAADPAGWSSPETTTAYAPVVDGETVLDMPWEAMLGGAGREVDLLAGYNRDEFALFAPWKGFTDRDVPRVARALGLDDASVDAYQAAYPGISGPNLCTLMFSDSLFRMPTVWAAEAHAAAGGRTYLYEFAWPSPVLGGALGACHALDIPFVFGNPNSPMGTMLLGDPPPADFHRLSEQIRRSWLSFAATGDPDWPRFTPDQALTRIWDLPPSVASDPRAASRRIWERASQGGE
ncbi:MAG: carboxylesterase family protein [Streptosporangiales bacterium]|nr:carboxylesterase family protein [Streptosporangiales bacterium]